MTDYTKYKKVISKYKFKRILQNRRADLCVVYLMKPYVDVHNVVREEVVACSGVFLDGFVYTDYERTIFLKLPTNNAFRYKVDGDFRQDKLAYYPVCKAYPF